MGFFSDQMKEEPKSELEQANGLIQEQFKGLIVGLLNKYEFVNVSNIQTAFNKAMIEAGKDFPNR